MNQAGETLSHLGSRGGLMTMRARALVIAGFTVMTILAMALVPRIPQSQSYHNFVDQRSVLGIPSFLNVVSNLTFLLVGIAGLLFLSRRNAPAERGSFLERSERWPYVTFFLGVTLTCFGSAYYHLAPDNDRLMWDRLPMSIAFLSLLAAFITERINLRAGLVSLLPLLAAGAGSVVYWHLTEQGGSGDLRFYILVQFYSILAIVLIAAMFPSSYSGGAALLCAVLCYAVAKVFELLDAEVFALGRIVSGHTLKHLAAAASAWSIIHMLKHRVPKPYNLIVSPAVDA